MKRTLTLLFTIIVILNLCSFTEKMITPTEKSSTTTQTEIQATATERPKNDIDYSEHSFAIHYIDVGQGDAALVVCDDKTMLIDGGKPSASSIIYTYLKILILIILITLLHLTQMMTTSAACLLRWQK